MKTFDEALNKVMMGAGTREEFIASLQKGTDMRAQLENPIFVAIVGAVVRITIDRGLEKGPFMIPGVIATGLHTVFQIGLLVGREMEKNDPSRP